MGLFSEKKGEDMQCWKCKNFISHHNVIWNPRKIGDITGTGIFTETIRESLKKSTGSDLASPNQIFGGYEYEYRGHCPECKAELTAFWFGLESIKRNDDYAIQARPFSCGNCENRIEREEQFWYSQSFQQDGQITEYLITICPNCQDGQIYPYEYNLELGVIE